jgi:hypothetical protein
MRQILPQRNFAHTHSIGVQPDSGMLGLVHRQKYHSRDQQQEAYSPEFYTTYQFVLSDSVLQHEHNGKKDSHLLAGGCSARKSDQVWFRSG